MINTKNIDTKINFDRISTKILDKNGNSVLYTICTIKEDLAEGIEAVVIKIGDRIVGKVTYYKYPYCIHITRMDNFTVSSEDQLSHVGTALFECVFTISIEQGLDGRVTLRAIEAAPPAYFKMGFRCQPSFNNITQPQNNVGQHNMFALLAVMTTTCNTEEYTNSKLAEMIASGQKLTASDCILNGFCCNMYLPLEQIELNKRKFLESIETPDTPPTLDKVHSIDNEIIEDNITTNSFPKVTFS